MWCQLSSEVDRGGGGKIQVQAGAEAPTPPEKLDCHKKRETATKRQSKLSPVCMGTLIACNNGHKDLHKMGGTWGMEAGSK